MPHYLIRTLVLAVVGVTVISLIPALTVHRELALITFQWDNVNYRTENDYVIIESKVDFKIPQDVFADPPTVISSIRSDGIRENSWLAKNYSSMRYTVYDVTPGGGKASLLIYTSAKVVPTAEEKGKDTDRIFQFQPYAIGNGIPIASRVRLIPNFTKPILQPWNDLTKSLMAFVSAILVIYLRPIVERFSLKDVEKEIKTKK